MCSDFFSSKLASGMSDGEAKKMWINKATSNNFLGRYKYFIWEGFELIF